MKNDETQSLSCLINITVLPAKGRRVKLEPDKRERKRLADEASVLSVEWFVAELVFKRWQVNVVSITGTVRANLTQECVVTLEPLQTTVHEEVDRTFVPEGSKLLRPKLNNEGELIVDYDGRDEPEPFVGENLDAWEIAIEHFLIGIDPYPRKPGAEFTPLIESDGSDSLKESPFAALKGLIKPKD